MNTYYSKELCKIHQEPCTNICIDTKCLQQLCPECIEIHFREHKECQIDSLKQCRKNCSNKLRQAIQEMNRILTLPEFQTIQNQSQYIETCREQLQQFKQVVIDKIEIYNKKLLSELQTQLVHAFKESQIKEVYNRIRNLIDQLDELGDQLDSATDFQIKTIKSILLLNTNQLVGSANLEANKEIQKLKFPVLVIQSQINSQIDQLLSSKINVQLKTIQNDPIIIQETYQIIEQKKNQQNDLNQNVSFLSKISENNKSKIHSDFSITEEDYFNPNVQFKFLHYFKYNSKELHLINLENLKDTKTIQLKINYFLPVFHQSIVTKKGQLYLLGGSVIDNNYPNIKSNQILLYDKDTLINIGQMLQGRSSQGCCIVGDYIYSISGLGQNQVIEKSCERFNYVLRKSEQIYDCNYPSIASCCINYNNTFIYKFGGLSSGNQMNLIERYNIKDMIWQKIDPKINNQDAQLFKGLKQFSAGIQISQNNLLIFGGYDENSISSNQSFIFNIQGENHFISFINQKPLKIPAGFWHQQCIIMKQELYVVQNLENKNGEAVEQKQVAHFKDRWNVI